MLFDERWAKRLEQETIWTLDRLVTWLESKPAIREYDYRDPRYCAAAQYLKEQGHYLPLDGEQLRHMGWWDTLAPMPWTYGDAARRGRKLLQAEEARHGSKEKAASVTN